MGLLLTGRRCVHGHLAPLIGPMLQFALCLKHTRLTGTGSKAKDVHADNNAGLGLMN